MEQKILIFIIVGAILLYIVQVFATYNILTFWETLWKNLVPENMDLRGGKRCNSRKKKRSN